MMTMSNDAYMDCLLFIYPRLKQNKKKTFLSVGCYYFIKEVQEINAALIVCCCSVLFNIRCTNKFLQTD